MNLIDRYGEMYVFGLGGFFVILLVCLLGLFICLQWGTFTPKRRNILHWWPVWWGGIGLFMAIPWFTFIISQWGVSLVIDSLLSIGLWVSIGGIIGRFSWEEYTTRSLHSRLGVEKTWIHRGGLVLMGFFFLGVGYMIFV